MIYFIFQIIFFNSFLKIILYCGKIFLFKLKQRNTFCTLCRMRISFKFMIFKLNIFDNISGIFIYLILKIFIFYCIYFFKLHRFQINRNLKGKQKINYRVKSIMRKRCNKIHLPYFNDVILAKCLKNRIIYIFLNCLIFSKIVLKTPHLFRICLIIVNSIIIISK